MTKRLKYVHEPNYQGIEVTYNVYQCRKCSYVFDLEHHLCHSLKILCDRCNALMEHTLQIDQYTCKELYG